MVRTLAVTLAVVILAVLCTVAAGKPKARPPTERTMLLLFYDDVSLFHGGGEALWIGRDGAVVVRKLVGGGAGRKDGVNRIYRLKLAEDERARIEGEVQRIGKEPIQQPHLTPIPDDVLDQIGFLAGDELRQFSVFARQWDRQPAALRRAREIALETLARVKRMKPVETIPQVPQDLYYWPPELLPPK